MAGLDPAIQKSQQNRFEFAALDGRVKPTAVRFKFVDLAHGIDSSVIRKLPGNRDTETDQRHAA